MEYGAESRPELSTLIITCTFAFGLSKVITGVCDLGGFFSWLHEEAENFSSCVCIAIEMRVEGSDAFESKRGPA
jgi:hypothetical protein